jgi:hephaestin
MVMIARVDRQGASKFLAISLGIGWVGAIALGCGGNPEDFAETSAAVGVTRTYFIAADEVIWDYAPSNGINLITGEPFDDQANVFVQQGPQRIGHKYWKALYREYTDSTFTHLKPRPQRWSHLGFLGPVVRASVGDSILVHFKNNTTRPVSIHPHGVFYNKNAEGAPYDDGTRGGNKADDAVPPGRRFDYRWQVPERAGPGPADGSSVFWMYHSHTDEVADNYAGLMGPIIVTGAGKGDANAVPTDVDRELVTEFFVSDENQSPYLDRNITDFTDGTVSPDDEDFIESNKMHSINGLLFGNLQGLTMDRGQRVRWNLMGMGTEVDLHTPHWHGNTVLIDGHRQDVTELLPASLKTADMRPDDPGTWLYHCHVNDHILAGMLALYTVNP